MAAVSDKPGGRHFEVTGIEKTATPGNDKGTTWYRYTIGEGDSEITGLRAGSRASVLEHAEVFAENLNRRLALGYSAHRPRKLPSQASPDRDRPETASRPGLEPQSHPDSRS